MNKRQEGIILKNYMPKKHKLCILDKYFGRIECTVAHYSEKKALHTGSLIAYEAIYQGFLYDLHTIELIEIPLQLARYDLYFFYHVLELSYYFVPLQSCVHNIFDLVYFLLYSYEKVTTYREKKLFLLRFFFDLGMYPEEYRFGKGLHDLLSRPIDIMLKEKIIISEYELEQWLCACINMHPQKSKFNTKVLGLCHDN